MDQSSDPQTPQGSPPNYSDNERASLVAADLKVDPAAPSSSAAPIPMAAPVASPYPPMATPYYGTPSPLPAQAQPQQQPQAYSSVYYQAKQPPQEMSLMAVFMNFWWFFVGGGVFVLMIYLSFALLMAITIIGWPIAVDLFRAGLVAAFPYGRQIARPEKCDCKLFWLHTIWIPFGICVYFLHLGLSILYMMSLIFIPFGLQHFALARHGLSPFGIKVYNRNVECSDLFSISYYINPPAILVNQPEVAV